MKLKILGLNFDIQWKNKALNYELIENQFENEEADIFVLPEMFSTGFCMDAKEISDKNNETLKWMKTFAKNKNSAVAGSVSVEENGKYFNRFYFVKPDGTFEFYDKRHLFSYSGENKIYTVGTERKILNYKNIRILLQICYDLRFPVFSRNNDDYDLIIYVANWPKIRANAWKHLLKARAIENLSYVFGLNRIGNDGNDLKYAESSYCFFADGTEISEKKDHLISAEIDLEKLKIFRKKFSFLNDRDSFRM